MCVYFYAVFFIPLTDHAEIWAPRLHPLGPSLVSRSDKSASGDGVPARGRRSRGRRRVVVYLRGGLCALVSFEEASLQLDVGESSVCRQQADVIGEEASGDCGAEETCGSDPDTRCCHGEEEQRRKEGYPDSCGVDPAEVSFFFFLGGSFSGVVLSWPEDTVNSGEAFC